MTRVDVIVPAPAALRAPLRKITEALAAELGSPTERQPDWSALEWRLARAVASMHGVSPLLAGLLRWSGPPDFRRFLDEQRDHTARRHARVMELVEAIDDRARAAGIAVQPLKGVALHGLGIYRAGERPMADVDLLVRERDLDAAAALLATLGYRQSYDAWKHRAFQPHGAETRARPGEHCDNPVKIDLHGRIREKLPHRGTDITALVFPDTACPGVNSYPSRCALFLHVLLHAAGEIVNHGARLIHLNDIQRLASRLTSAEWQEVVARGVDERGLPWALPPLRLAARYFPAAVPESVMAMFGRNCAWWLERASRRQTVSDVSFSDPFVAAAPGLWWSRSPADAVRYVLQRIVDGRRPEFRFAADAELWASETSWYRVSQAGRLLIWLRSRPPRVQTMHSVRAALESAE